MSELTPGERAEYDERTAWAYGRPAADAQECDGPEEATRRQVEDAQRAEIAEAAYVPRTSAATAANVRRRLDRNGQELTDQGWFVVAPDDDRPVFRIRDALMAWAADVARAGGSGGYGTGERLSL